MQTKVLFIYIEEGRLLPRSAETISECIDDFVVIENENQVIACAGLKVYEQEKVGEIYALVVNKSFHNTDTSSKLMQLLIDKATNMELISIFALSNLSVTSSALLKLFISTDFIVTPLLSNIKFIIYLLKLVE